MKNKIIFLSLVVAMVLMASCASIVSKNRYPISINSKPSDASISITDANGVEVYKGETPAAVNLKASEKYFKKATYQVRFNKDGYDERVVSIYFKVDGWYWGNLLFGGLIGMLIVDPATGAMYKLDTEFVMETLTQSTASADKKELRIYSIDEIPAESRSHLVPLTK